MEPLSNELDLIQRVKEGDQQAFLALYDRYAPRVHALTLRILNDTMLAEEVTQDTFLKLWNHARLYLAERGPFLSWLLTIAHRTALDRLRAEGRRPLLSDSTDPDSLWPMLADTNQNADEVRWRSMYFAMQALIPDQKTVIELAYYQGLSQSEIAQELGWPLGTVKTRMRAALESLRHEWKRDDDQ
ncbi:MAG: sigma-70 family RNA polymerase sigma factor [Chloroflexi bacterium]|nr:sigma-70 family RNA polymerase sigma factor [Chloroflexota bacterium]